MFPELDLPKKFVLSSQAQNLIYVDINEGVGVGIIYQGEIYRGAFGMAGEFGHTSIDMNGPLCSCGNRGCLERLISTPWIIENIVRELDGETAAFIDIYGDGVTDKIDFGMVARAFRESDPVAMQILSKTALQLSFGINNITRIIDPEIIVIGGGIEILGSAFLDLVIADVHRNGALMLPSEVEIRYTELPPEYKNKGSAKYYIDNIMKFTVNKEKELIIC